jgi:phospholipid N-methyltransferase
VISGIPFTLFASREREAVIRNTHELLSPNGIFVVYQYSPFVFPILKKFFSDVEISFEPRNFLPYFIMRARK